MFARRLQPVIGNPAGSGNWDSATSPRSPLEIQSPRGPRKYDLGGGIGLGILAALEKSDRETRPGYKKPVHGTNLSISNPVPVTWGGRKDGVRWDKRGTEMESLEDYTLVTYHGLNNTSSRSSSRILYYVDDDDDDDDDEGKKGHEKNMGFDFDQKILKKYGYGYGCGGGGGGGRAVFNISSSPSSSPEEDRSSGDFPDSDLLSCCHLCHKSLHGKDIYMYRGEEAYCSSECRSVQITKDERREEKKQQQQQQQQHNRSATTNNTIIHVSTPSSAYATTSRLIFPTRILAT